MQHSSSFVFSKFFIKIRHKLSSEANLGPYGHIPEAVGTQLHRTPYLPSPIPIFRTHFLLVLH